MAEKRGLRGTRVVGKPYTMDGVFADDIRDYIHSIPAPADARFTSRTENCYTTNHSQENTCQTTLHNECCVGHWKAGPSAKKGIGDV